MQEADFLILFPGYIEDAVLRAGRRLKLIQLVSAGFDRFNLALCREMGIPVANNGGSNAIDVAEHTLALILGFYRRLVEMDRNVRMDPPEQGWRAIDSGATTYTIYGKTVGIIGLGNIGRRVARLLRAFEADLLYYHPYPVPEAVERELGVRRMELAALLAQADVVSLHVRLDAQTRGVSGSTG
ncbi:lactate dehydrogenase, partial [Litorilinea aerophila]